MRITPIHSRENKLEYKMPFVPVFQVEGADTTARVLERALAARLSIGHSERFRVEGALRGRFRAVRVVSPDWCNSR